MRHKAEMYDAVRWMLIGMGASLLFACMNGNSSQGHSNLPQHILDAKTAIKPHYPEAVKLPIVIEDHNDLSRAMSYEGGKIYVSTGVIADHTARGETGTKLTACFLVHEWVHHIQAWRGEGWNESEAYAETAECLRKLDAPQHWIDRYQSRV